jgi:hypothetical protein
LAIVFGPNIIRAQVQTVQCALEMPLLQGILQILIEHSAHIWDNGLSNPPLSARSRPLSTLYLGKDLKPTLQLPESTTPSKLRNSIGVHNPPASPDSGARRAPVRAPTGDKIKESLRIFERVDSPPPTAVRVVREKSVERVPRRSLQERAKSNGNMFEADQVNAVLQSVTLSPQIHRSKREKDKSTSKDEKALKEKPSQRRTKTKKTSTTE